MLLTYLRRVTYPLAHGVISTGLMIAFSIGMGPVIFPSVAIPMLLIHLSAQYLLERLLQRLLPGNVFFSQNIPGLAALITFIIGPVFFTLFLPHLFLFFNALPLAFSTTFFAVSTFLISFELNIRFPSNNLGPDYSLVKLLLNPRTQLGVLRQTLYRPQHGVAAERRPWENRQNVIDLNRMLRNMNQGVRERGAILKDPNLLQLSEANRNQLVDRQKAAIKGLPKDAIIDDIRLYEKYFAAEKKSGAIEQEEKRKNSRLTKPLEGSDLTNSVQIAHQNAAKKQSKDAAIRLETNYLSNLSEPQQTAYREYREFIKNYSLPYAECTITYEDVVSSPKEFIIMEKRKPQSNTKAPSCISGKTFIWHHKNGFLPLFTMGTEHAGEEPSSRDKFFLPDNKESGYAFHTYEMVDRHPLSLQLCEIIENLAPILSLHATKSSKNELFNQGINENITAARYRLTPPHDAVTTSNSRLSLYGQGNTQDSEDELLHAFLENLTPEELAFNHEFWRGRK